MSGESVAFNKTITAPSSPLLMAQHLEHLAAAIRRGAVVVEGGLIAMNELHLRGDIQLAEKPR